MNYNGKTVREDGLTIFLCEDGLDDIKKNGTKEQVIMAVGYKCMRAAALNYCSRYAPEMTDQIKHNLPEIQHVGGLKLLKSFDF